MPWALVDPVYDPSVRSLCARRYPGHPRGCPNHGKRPSCPPAAPLLPKVLDLSRDVWAVWNDFDIGGHVERMRTKHPGWSDRQLYCCLYWQGAARKNLRCQIAMFVLGCPSTITTRELLYSPEACGVNVTETMAALDVVLEWPPRRIARQVALAGYPVGRERRAERC